MDTLEFDDFKEELRETISALIFMTDIFESKLLDEYTSLIEKGCDKEYNELFSIHFILEQLSKILKQLKEKFSDC